MKNPLPAFLFAVSSLCLPAMAQKAGDAVTPEALGKLEWIAGEAPAKWESGQVYILECWTTWCGPCIAAIPHVDALHDKYHEKGLNILGINVWEDGKDKVAEFVKAKGDGMSYPVAYTGKGGAFETEWLVPAGVTGIPHAFVVKDGKVLLTIHPALLTEEIIEGLLEGGEAEARMIKRLAGVKKTQAQTGEIMRAFRKAKSQNETEAMAEAIADLKELDAESRYLPSLELELHVTKKDWQQAGATLDKIQDSPDHMMAILQIARAVLTDDEVPEAFTLKLIEGFSSVQAAAPEAHPGYTFLLSKLQWKAGQKDAATASARKAADATKDPKFSEVNLHAPYQRYADALEKGEMPTDEEFTGWVREAMPKQD